MNISVFLPCRKGSQRVPKKNIKIFAGHQYGLIQIKLEQLLGAKTISKIYLSTNDDEIIKFARTIKNNKLIIHNRSEELSSNDTSTDDLIEHACSLIQEGDILWTHVTSPFLTSSDYDAIVKKYYEMINLNYDSLMTTNLLHSFLWDKNTPINYDRNIEKWPRTQTLHPIHEVNSAVFLANVDTYQQKKDRIGDNPYLYVLNKIKGFDIDWDEDFKIAEAMLDSKVATI